MLGFRKTEHDYVKVRTCFLFLATVRLEEKNSFLMILRASILIPFCLCFLFDLARLEL